MRIDPIPSPCHRRTAPKTVGGILGERPCFMALPASMVKIVLEGARGRLNPSQKANLNRCGGFPQVPILTLGRLKATCSAKHAGNPFGRYAPCQTTANKSANASPWVSMGKVPSVFVNQKATHCDVRKATHILGLMMSWASTWNGLGGSGDPGTKRGSRCL
jgi:hypothetical protein